MGLKLKDLDPACLILRVVQAPGSGSGSQNGGRKSKVVLPVTGSKWKVRRNNVDLDWVSPPQPHPHASMPLGHGLMDLRVFGELARGCGQIMGSKMARKVEICGFPCIFKNGKIVETLIILVVPAPSHLHYLPIPLDMGAGVQTCVFWGHTSPGPGWGSWSRK